jgi:hypothetical protein
MTGRENAQPPAGMVVKRSAPGRVGRIRADVGRIAELKAKLGDEDYMSGAILRIATVLSARLTEGYLNGGRTTR